MQDFTPLYVDIDLPEGALLRDDAAQASVVDACHPNDAQAIWYHAHAPAMTFNAQKAMTQWHTAGARRGGIHARGELRLCR